MAEPPVGTPASWLQDGPVTDETIGVFRDKAPTLIGLAILAGYPATLGKLSGGLLWGSPTEIVRFLSVKGASSFC